MALASAAVLGLMNYANRRRAPNCRRVALRCRTTEWPDAIKTAGEWHYNVQPSSTETGSWLHSRWRWSLV